MNETSTPGPWKVAPYVDAIDVLDAKGLPVAHIADRPIMVGYGDPPANARLIAACPVMYEFIFRKSQEGDADATAIITSIHG